MLLAMVMTILSTWTEETPERVIKNLFPIEQHRPVYTDPVFWEKLQKIAIEAVP